jgi:hypothetical protein
MSPQDYQNDFLSGRISVGALQTMTDAYQFGSAASCQWLIGALSRLRLLLSDGRTITVDLANGEQLQFINVFSFNQWCKKEFPDL